MSPTPRFLKRLRRDFKTRLSRAGVHRYRDYMGEYTSTADPREHAREATTELERLFYAHNGRIAHKWGHYLPIYDRLLGPYRAGFPTAGGGRRPLRFLEIGVSKGGSLQLWRKFFGPEAHIFGIDVDPACREVDDADLAVRIGSQDDPDFLAATVMAMGGLDIVLDDGSHMPRHLRTSFDVLFPLLSDGGLYVVEDLQTSYWPKWEGGLRRRGTFVEFAKSLIDDMNAWYHQGGRTFAAGEHDIASLCFHNAVVVIEKRRQARPFHIKVG